MPVALENTRRKSEPFAPHRQCGRDPRLQDTVAFDDSAQNGIQARPVERMRHLADEPPDRLAREPRVRIERNHVAHILGHGGGRQECGVLGAPQEPIEFAAASRACVPTPSSSLRRRSRHAPPMQQQEAVAARCRSVTLVQLRDAFFRGGQQLFVAVYVLAWRVAPIGQQGEMKFALGTRQIVDLEPADLLLDVLERGQQRRHGDERAQVSGDSATQLERRQQGGAETSGDDVVDNRNGQVDRWDQSQNPEQQQPSPLHTVKRGDRQRDGQQAGCDERRRR